MDGNVEETEIKDTPKTLTSKPLVGLPIPKHDSIIPTQPGIAKTGIDINAIGQHEGVDIIDIDPSTFEDKPWRNPGADITDYFNFGFDEKTWAEYSAKQRMFRDELANQKKISRRIKEDSLSPRSIEDRGERSRYGRAEMMDRGRSPNQSEYSTGRSSRRNSRERKRSRSPPFDRNSRNPRERDRYCEIDLRYNDRNYDRRDRYRR